MIPLPSVKMRKQRVAEKRHFTDENGYELFEYPRLSLKATRQLLRLLIDGRVGAIEPSLDEKRKQDMQIELVVLANCWDWLNSQEAGR